MHQFVLLMLIFMCIYFAVFIVGFIYLTGIALFFLFWMFHVVHVFASLAFPFKSERLMNSKTFRRRTFVVEIILILIFGFLPAIIVEVFGDYFYAGFPSICISNSTPLAFYSHLLPITIISTLGLCLLFASFWTLRKVSL